MGAIWRIGPGAVPARQCRRGHRHDLPGLATDRAHKVHPDGSNKPVGGPTVPGPGDLGCRRVSKALRNGFYLLCFSGSDQSSSRVQILPMFGVRTFRDVLDLEPGERWEKSLYRHIDESDIVLLFWSNAAKTFKVGAKKRSSTHSTASRATSPRRPKLVR